jgi:hypothetical protein
MTYNIFKTNSMFGNLLLICSIWIKQGNLLFFLAKYFNFFLQTGLVIACLFGNLFCQANDNDQVDKNVLETLSKNYGECNTILLVWESTYTSEMDMQQILQKIKFPDFYGFNEPIYQTYLWDNGKFYFHRSHKMNPVETLRINNRFPNAWEIRDSADLLTRVDENSFDGERYYSGNGVDVTGTSAGITIQELATVHQMNYRIFEDGHYTNCLGFKFPCTTVEVGNKHDSFVLHLIRNSEILDAHWDIRNGQRQYMIKCKSKNDWDMNDNYLILNLWLLPEYGYTIRQYDIHDIKGNLAYRIINSNFKKLLNSNVHLPHNTVIQFYTYATISGNISPVELFRETHTLVSATTTNIKLSQFDLRNKYAQSGTHFADYTLKDTENGLQYIYPANPADLDRVIEAALTGKDFVPTPLPSTTAIVIKWLLCIAGIAMIFYAGYKKFVKK